MTASSQKQCCTDIMNDVASIEWNVWVYELYWFTINMSFIVIVSGIGSNKMCWDLSQWILIPFYQSNPPSFIFSIPKYSTASDYLSKSSIYVSGMHLMEEEFKYSTYRSKRYKVSSSHLIIILYFLYCYDGMDKRLKKLK